MSDPVPHLSASWLRPTGLPVQRNIDLKRLKRVALVIFAGAVAFDLVTARAPETFFGFVAVLTVASIPFFVWIKRGAMQLPILPCAALFYVPSYANPGSLVTAGSYTPGQILVGELTVALFLGVAVIAWSFFTVEKGSGALNRGRRLDVGQNLRRVMFVALMVGMVFEMGTISGWWFWMGTFFGTFRTVVSSATIIGCFLFGAALGKRALRPSERVLGAILLAAIFAIETSSLLLYVSILNAITVFFGYFLFTKKIPWTAITVCLVIATTLHSAKSGMRAKYWSNGLQPTSLSDVPGIMTEWIGNGVNNMIFGAPDDQQNLADRASMLPNLLLVQQSSPELIPFLNGETYANFWKMLIPRFLSPNKITSQTNLGILSIHYHLQVIEDTATTTLSWGLISEGYANFGIYGVVFAGLAFGALLGWLTHWSAGAPVISLRGFIGLASMIVPITSVAYDFSYMLLNLIQGIVAMVVVSLALSLLQGSAKRLGTSGTSRMNAVHS